MNVQIPVEAGNKAVQNGTVQKVLESMLSQLKPEATYFLGQKGLRATMIIFDLEDSSQLPAICEPLFQELNAKVDIVPAMNLDELQAGLQRLGQRA